MLTVRQDGSPPGTGHRQAGSWLISSRGNRRNPWAEAGEEPEVLSARDTLGSCSQKRGGETPVSAEGLPGAGPRSHPPLPQAPLSGT